MQKQIELLQHNYIQQLTINTKALLHLS